MPRGPVSAVQIGRDAGQSHDCLRPGRRVAHPDAAAHPGAPDTGAGENDIIVSGSQCDPITLCPRISGYNARKEHGHT